MDPKGQQFSTFESFKVCFDEKTMNHPFKTGRQKGRFYDDLVQGKVPLEFLREYAKQFYIFIQFTNANVTWTLVNYMDLWRQHPDLYDIVAAKIGSELSDPGPGGHGRTYVKFARYLGLKDEDLFSAKPTPDLEALAHTGLRYRSQSAARTAVRWMLEGFVGYNMKSWRDTLHEKYNVPDDVLEYWDIHVKADLEEHGPEGETLLRKLYHLGLVRENDYEGMKQELEKSAPSWQEAFYSTFRAELPQ